MQISCVYLARFLTILIYGLPGTGKTELVKTLCAACNISLRAVSFKDEESNTLDGEKRLSNFQVIQQALKDASNTAVLFDEATDLFPVQNLLFGSTSKISKNMINNALENNTLPSFFVVNSIRGIDEAYLSRFSFILDMPQMNKQQRKKILVNNVPPDVLTQLSPTWIDNVVANTSTTARQLLSATQTLKLVETNKKNYQSSLGSLLEMHQRYQQQPLKNAHDLPQYYSTEFINCDYNCDLLTKKLQQAKSAKLLFSGLPGTGKTLFAQYIVQSLNVEYQLISSSDLIDKYVGESEKNIAQLFKTASQKNIALIFDEVDSLLGDRSHMQQHFEVTQVNEFLNQLEAFKGIVICTTNYLEALDKAVYRRFHFKLVLAPLLPKQRLKLLKKIAKQHNLVVSSTWRHITQQLNELLLLTPGDFNAVNARLTWLGIESVEDYLKELQVECNFKQPNSKQKMGFV